MKRTLDRVLKILDGQPTGKRGQSFVEMAFATPFLIAMVMGLVEIGFAANNFLILMDAVREAGRLSVNLDPITWPYNQARNQEAMDCDTTMHAWNLLHSDVTASSEGKFPGDRDHTSTIPGLPSAIEAAANTPTTPRGINIVNYFTANLGGRNNYQEPGTLDGPEGVPPGFFDTVACQAVISMQPLNVNDNDATSKDDVVVSAVSYTNMNYSTLAPASQGSNYAASPGAHGDHWITVTGRWPIENRYCRPSLLTSSADMDNRDPFDYMRYDIDKNYHNGTANATSASWDDNPSADGTTPPFERVADTPPAAVTDPEQLKDFHLLEYSSNNGLTISSNTNQGIRGFALLGNHKSSPDNCFGSDFTVQDIEAKLNLDPINNPHVPNGGLVIVEIFWQYHPLVFGPLFEGFNSQDKTSDPVFHVWGFFPVSGAESTATP